MEEKIYQRQVAKESLSQRVIDSNQIERHFTNKELREMYDFRPDIYDPEKEQIPIMPSDNLLKDILTECKRWIARYHEHDSLLENLLNEGLSEEERKAAWDEYEAEKKLNVLQKALPNAAWNAPTLANLATSSPYNVTKKFAHNTPNMQYAALSANSSKDFNLLQTQFNDPLHFPQIPFANINPSIPNQPLIAHKNNGNLNVIKNPTPRSNLKEAHVSVLKPRNIMNQDETLLYSAPHNNNESSHIQSLEQTNLNIDEINFDQNNENQENSINNEMHTPDIEDYQGSPHSMPDLYYHQLIEDTELDESVLRTAVINK